MLLGSPVVSTCALEPPADVLLDISAFAVHPLYQGQGIGSQLLKHCLDITNKSSLRTWLIAFPGSHSLYLRFGFKDVEYRDVDLNAWDNGRLRGYGVYRQYAMVRRQEIDGLK